MPRPEDFTVLVVLSGAVCPSPFPASRVCLVSPACPALQVYPGAEVLAAAAAFAQPEAASSVQPEATASVPLREPVFARSEVPVFDRFEAAAAARLAAVSESSNCPARFFASVEPAADSGYRRCSGAKKAAGRCNRADYPDSRERWLAGSLAPAD